MKKNKHFNAWFLFLSIPTKTVFFYLNKSLFELPNIKS